MTAAIEQRAAAAVAAALERVATAWRGMPGVTATITEDAVIVEGPGLALHRAEQADLRWPGIAR